MVFLRRIALNALNREQTYKRSLAYGRLRERQKSKQVVIDNDYMIQVLNSCFLNNTIYCSYPLCQP